MNKYIEITKAKEGKWYDVGEQYLVRDEEKYRGIGVQVYNGDINTEHPDVVMDGDYKYI